jgi:hypothetical protein
MTTFCDNINKFEEIVKILDSEIKTVKTLIKEIKKNYNNDIKKKTKKIKDSDSTVIKKKHGITEPKILPKNINEFIKYALKNKKLSEDFINNNNDIFEKFSTETLIARTKVNSIIHNYIKANNLYANEDKHSIFAPDDKLKKLFEIEDKEELNLKNLQSFLKRAYDKFKDDDTNVKVKKLNKEEEEDDEEEEDEEEDEEEEEEE